MPIPFYLINGFLGSGKTTLLKRILNEYADDKKIGVIQNEFAAINVDSAELQREQKTFAILEVNRGSVFCVCLLSDFITSLRHFIDDHHPEALFLEASGLSDPISIIELLSARIISTSMNCPIRLSGPSKLTTRLFSLRPDICRSLFREGPSTSTRRMLPTMAWLKRSARPAMSC